MLLTCLMAVSTANAPAAGAAVASLAPSPVCAVSDQRISELSGLAGDGRQWFAVNDGGSQVEVFVLDRNCAVQRRITAPTDPYDVEDLARAPDGTLWLSDTGDNDKKRDTVALLAVTPQGRTTLYRLTYPDGRHDAEALLLDARGTPYLVTKNPFGDSGIYTPAGRLTSPGPTPLTRAGSLSFHSTGTPGGPVAGFGSVLVTGGATSADGKMVALRTYTDAYLYSAPDGDVLAALRREPVRVRLPDEPQGEAIAFEPDGTLLSGGEGIGQPIRAMPGAVALAANTSTGPASPAGNGETATMGRSSGMRTMPGLLLAVALACALVFGGGWIKRRLGR